MKKFLLRASKTAFPLIRRENARNEISINWEYFGNIFLLLKYLFSWHKGGVKNGRKNKKSC
ncbi:hypothetical protein A2U10_07135 [Fusobacterium necrophorum subsp. funduliforme]|nr:hypothetical protein A2U10_07135 [Fusobacterium necrophorum subsp. funduliforme]